MIIEKNFPDGSDDYYKKDRLFDDLYYTDQYKHKHLLTLFLSQITPPDTTSIEFDDGELRRGIRTLGEVAHYVRCIPFKPSENNRIWASPDFL